MDLRKGAIDHLFGRAIVHAVLWKFDVVAHLGEVGKRAGWHANRVSLVLVGPRTGVAAARVVRQTAVEDLCSEVCVVKYV